MRYTSEAEVRAFYDGLREGTIGYAVWLDGEQRVGVMRTPLRDVLRRIQNDEDRDLAALVEEGS